MTTIIDEYNVDPLIQHLTTFKNIKQKTLSMFSELRRLSKVTVNVCEIFVHNIDTKITQLFLVDDYEQKIKIVNGLQAYFNNICKKFEFAQSCIKCNHNRYHEFNILCKQIKTTTDILCFKVPDSYDEEKKENLFDILEAMDGKPWALFSDVVSPTSQRPISSQDKMNPEELELFLKQIDIDSKQKEIEADRKLALECSKQWSQETYKEDLLKQQQITEIKKLELVERNKIIELEQIMSHMTEDELNEYLLKTSEIAALTVETFKFDQFHNFVKDSLVKKNQVPEPVRLYVAQEPLRNEVSRFSEATGYWRVSEATGPQRVSEATSQRVQISGSDESIKSSYVPLSGFSSFDNTKSTKSLFHNYVKQQNEDTLAEKLAKKAKEDTAKEDAAKELEKANRIKIIKQNQLDKQKSIDEVRTTGILEMKAGEYLYQVIELDDMDDVGTLPKKNSIFELSILSCFLQIANINMNKGNAFGIMIIKLTKNISFEYISKIINENKSTVSVTVRQYKTYMDNFNFVNLNTQNMLSDVILENVFIYDKYRIVNNILHVVENYWNVESMISQKCILVPDIISFLRSEWNETIKSLKLESSNNIELDEMLDEFDEHESAAATVHQSADWNDDDMNED
jgi:hypothetical protein